MRHDGASAPSRRHRTKRIVAATRRPEGGPSPVMLTSSLPKRFSNKAAALIIVLAFVVLLTGLALAYLSRATSDRQLAHTSFHDTDADLLARTALDIVVGDFRQEISNGSTNPAVTPSSTTIYMPKDTGLGAAANMVPQRSSQIAAGVPNLIRQSVRSDAFIGNPAPPSRASAVNSQDNPSANGRSISSTRWNGHYLVPKGDTTTSDSSPIPAFTNATPDWVFVKAYNPVTQASPGPTVIASADPLVVGRYAYAVYDEGGLLDINVAGYPTGASPTVTDIGRKGVLAFADLTALPTTLSTAAINNFILFRNYATMGSTGTLGNGITFTSAQPFVNYYLGNPQIGTSQDFGQVNRVHTGSGPSFRTDQSFINRAELINFVKSLVNAGVDINVNTLQYLGTFSREQNKPTFQLSTAWPFLIDASHKRVVLPQRFYLGNLNLAVYPSPTPTPIVTPTPTATPTLTPTIGTALGLQFASANTPPPATPTPTPTPGPCDLQVRWKYVGQNSDPAATPRPDIPAFPSDLSTLDFFQYINYALFGVTSADSNSIHIASTLQIGASIIDQYDNDQLTTGIYFGSNAATCDTAPAINACLVYGADAANPPPTPLPCVPSSPAYVSSGVFVNRPFRSVGEFGYAYNLLDAINNNNGVRHLTDFKDPYNSSVSSPNPDPALLDFFTYNTPAVRSGIISLNTRQAPVLAAILQGAIYNNSSSSVVSPSDAATAANSIVTATTTTPAMSRADIASLASTTVVTNSPFTNDDATTSEARETIARALSEVVQTRTWGLLIDLVAQTGHYKPNATSLTDDFIVEGEKHYWLHVAIDRFDGTIVGQQLEEVAE